MYLFLPPAVRLAFGLRAAACLLAIAVALLPGTGEVQAQTSNKLVGNTGQTSDALSPSLVRRAQPFTTGSNTYRLTRVDIEVDGSYSGPPVIPVTITIRTVNDSNRPGDSVGTLSFDSNASTASVVQFTALGIDLEPNTTYFLMWHSHDSTRKYRRTSSDDEDSDSVTGWSIGNKSLWHNLAVWIEEEESLKMDLYGYVSTSEPAVYIADAFATEGSAITFTVTLDRAVSGGFTVTPNFTDGTATAGVDYTVNTNSLSFTGTAGETQTFTVDTAADTDIEPNETFTVGLAVSDTTETVAATDTATGTIVDDESAQVTIADAAATEGSAITFMVTLDKAVSGGFTVTPNFTDGTATAGIDYTVNTNALSFTGTAGETKSFTVATTADTDVEANETFTVGLVLSGTTESVGVTDTATGTINDDDAPRVTIADAAAAEGSAMTFTVTLDKAVTGGLTVTPSFTDISATKGTDYTENTTALTFVGNAGETQSITVNTNQDTDVEPNETFTVALAVSGTSKSVTATDTATGTINDDDTVQVTIADASADEGSAVIFTVTLNKAVSGGLTVTPSFTDVDATKGTDYTENTTALTFAGNASETQSITVDTTEDTDVEPNETFTVALAVSGTAESVTATDTATGTINDNDTAQVTLEDASATEGSAITFTVSLDKAVSGGFTVTPSFTDVDATNGTDYTANTNTLTFNGTAGETRSFTVNTTADNDIESNETFTVGLAVSGTTAMVTSTDIAIGTITNDDHAVVTIDDASAAEGNAINFTVTLDKAVSGGFTLTPSFIDVDATEGSDYTENTNALTFVGTAGETKSFTVATATDTDVEPNETFTVTLAVSGTTVTVTSTDTATGTIVDDDRAAVTIADASATEGSKITFTVTLDKAVSGGFKVTPSFTDGTATKGTDYTENTNKLTFTGAAGETQSFTVNTTEDADIEPNETFTVGLTVSGTTAMLTSTATATGTINNDDHPQVTIEDASATEGSAIAFTVTLDVAVSGGFMLTPSYTDGTATEGTDYTANTNTLTFPGTAGETRSFSVNTTGDTDIEPNETFTVGLAVTGTSTTVTYTDTAIGTINDDDSAQVTIADAAATEGNAITFTVTLNKAVSGGITVTPSFTDVDATKGTDYTENTTALRFAGTANETQSITVNTTGDTDVEPNETFTVGLAVSDTTATVIATDTATGTIDDDDSAQVTVEDAAATEGNTITFTVSLDKAVSGGFTVTPTFTDGTATAGTDYTANTNSLTFKGTANETQSITVNTTEDTGVESNETFTVGLAVSGTTAMVTHTDTATGTINDDDSTQVPSNKLVGNTGQSHGGVSTAIARRAQPFTTGVDTYKLTRVDIQIDGSYSDPPTITIRSVNENNRPGDSLGTLSFSSASTASLLQFTSSGIDLQPDTTYFVMWHGTQSAPNYRRTNSNNEDSGSVRGWSIDDGSLWHNLAEWIEADDSLKMDLYGYVSTSTPVVNIADAAAAEGSAITFMVTVDKAVSGGFAVTPSFTDRTATAGTDYIVNTNALRFAGTAKETQSFIVNTNDDSDVEADETFTVGLAVSDTTVKVVHTATATGTINDDESAEVTITDAAATEGSAITFTVTLDKAVSGGFMVTPSFTDGTATEGTDYTANTNALTFTGTAGETKSFTVATAMDTDVEPNETFTVALAVSGTTAMVTQTATATGTINDDDSAHVTIEDAAATEGSAITFIVTLDKAVSGGLKVTPSFTDGTATEGTDYTANTNVLTFTGTAGETQSFTVSTTEDTDVEPNETFTVGLTASGTTESVIATATATGTIDDDDSAQVTIEDASATEGSAITFTVTLDKAVSGGFMVMPSFTDVDATKGTDYTENTNALTFSGTAGETHDIAVATTEDAGIESNETFTVGLAVSGTTAMVTATDTATGTINDDDSPQVTIEDSFATEGSAITFTVTLNKAVSGGFTVTPSYTDGTAAAGTDYTTNTNSLTFAGTAGETQNFEVATTEDTDIESNETFTVGLAVSGTTQTVIHTDTATGTINDNDSAQVTIEDALATEGSAITFMLMLDKTVSGGFTVTPSFTDGTAIEGTDYTANTDALTFAGTVGETQSFTVSTTEDTDVEPDETFTVDLAVSGTTAMVTATATATGTINDDDTAQVTIADASATEGSAITFMLMLDKAVSGGFTVTPSFTDVDATEGADYTANTNALTFVGTTGETQSFTVSTTQDADIESNETFTVDLAVSGTTAMVTATDPATGTINDDDSTQVTIEDAFATEGSAITFMVTLNKAVSGGFRVTPSYTDGTAAAGTDYTANTNALTFAGTAGETQIFKVATTEDIDIESNETFTVGLVVSGTTQTVVHTDTATGTISDNDSAQVTIEDAFATEGSAITFTVTLDKAVSDADGFKVTPSFTDGTAIEGTDYTANTDALTFVGTVGETQSITVSTTEDSDVEPNETFIVDLAVSGTTAMVAATDTATGTINNDDSAQVTIEDAFATEGSAITFMVTLNKAVSDGFTVTPSFTDGTAIEGTDYTANTDALTFAGTVGETQSFTVSTTEDTDVEPDETFTVDLAVSGTTAMVTATATATGTINDDDTAQVTIADASATEGSAITFMLMLDKAVSGGFTVTPSFTDVDATEGTDYTANTNALTFAGTTGETQSFTVATAMDTDVEPNETFTVGLSVSGTTAMVTEADSATGTINDDDSAQVTIEDAFATEGNVINFTVILDKAVSGGFTVTPSFTDGTATAGTDYTANTNPLTFVGTANETRSFTVASTEDAEIESKETFTVSLAVFGTTATVIHTDTATGTIDDDDNPLQRLWLSRFGRTVADHVTGAVSDRLANPLAGAQVTVGGQSVDLAKAKDEAWFDESMISVAHALGAGQGVEREDLDWPETRRYIHQAPALAVSPLQDVSDRELLLGSAFHLTSEGDGTDPGLAAWVQVTTSGFDGVEPTEAGNVSIEGKVTTGILGADATWERLLAGVAVSVSSGKGTFDQPDVDSVAIESRLTAVSPYARVAVSERVSAWGLLGYGKGDMVVVQGQPERMTRTDIRMRLVAVGGRGALMEVDEPGRMNLALKTDAFLVETESIADEEGIKAKASRMRLALEGSRTHELSGGMRTLGLEFGLRHDGGDAESGTGVELGGWLSYAEAGNGLRMEANVRALVAHEDSEYREWGASGMIRLDPGVDGRGLSFSLAPTYGAAVSGVDRLWSVGDARGLAPEGEFKPEKRLEGELGYGLPVFGGRFTGTPNLGFGVSDRERKYRIGWRLTPTVPGDSGFEMSLDVTRKESVGEVGLRTEPEHSVMLHGTMHW